MESANDPRVLIGVGRAEEVIQVTVRWPSGKLQDLGPIAPVDRTLVVDERPGLSMP